MSIHTHKLTFRNSALSLTFSLIFNHLSSSHSGLHRVISQCTYAARQRHTCTVDLPIARDYCISKSLQHFSLSSFSSFFVKASVRFCQHSDDSHNYTVNCCRQTSIPKLQIYIPNARGYYCTRCVIDFKMCILRHCFTEHVPELVRI